MTRHHLAKLAMTARRLLVCRPAGHRWAFYDGPPDGYSRVYCRRCGALPVWRRFPGLT